MRFSATLIFIFTIVLSYSQIQKLERPSSDEFTKQILGHSETGTILKIINLNDSRTPLGVTVTSSRIVITSSNGDSLNYFDIYDLNGNYISSTRQNTTSKYGYRDLAFDGSYILASDDNEIDKIDPNTFSVIMSITNTDNSVHRGLAFDPNENVIYSSNYKKNILKIDPATGATIKILPKPAENIYGLAIDYFSNSNYASLWFSEPCSYSKFRLSKADTTEAKINFTYDLTNITPDSAYNGGLEIINNYPDFPDSIVALIVDQHNKQLNIVNISKAKNYFPSEFETVGEMGGFNATGIISSGMVQYENYLYFIDNKDLAIFELNTNPASPTRVKTVTMQNGNRIFLDNNFSNKLVVTTNNAGTNGFVAFDISDPINPIKKSATVTTNQVNSMILGSYAYVLEENVKKLFVYYMGNYSNPTINKEYDLNGNGTCLAIDKINHLLFVGCKGNYGEMGIEVFDISNPNLLIEKSFHSTNFAYPQKIIVKSSNKKIIVAVNENDEKSSRLNCYDYSDPNNIAFEKLIFTSNNNAIWDVKDVFDYLMVSIPNDQKIKTFRWDNESNIFLTGPEQTLESPIDIAFYSHSVPTSQSTVGDSDTYNHLFSDASNYERYFYIMNGYANGTQVSGSEKTEILKAKKIPAAGKVNLTMNIYPSEASSHGCSTIPASGIHQYNKNAGVNLYAIDNKTGGWYFTGWSGDASGSDLITHITMDKNKNITANFAELKLTISGTKIKETICPAKEHPLSTFLLPITICASDVDDWQVQKISLKTGGTGDELNDIKEVLVLNKNSSTIYSGSFSSDNATLDINFNPSLSVKAGECVELKLLYKFKYDKKTYAKDKNRTFYCETFATVAKPLHYDSGLIQGKALHDTLTFARVRNTSGYGFPTIQEAIDAETTKNIDTCLVCAGEYVENIKIEEKKLKIISVEGSDKTIISANDTSAVVSIINSENAEINGFTITAESLNGKGIFCSDPVSKNLKILNNKFEVLSKGIYIAFANNCTINKNIFRKCNLYGIQIERFSYGNEINNNTFAPSENEMFLSHSGHNKIGGNIFTSKADLIFYNVNNSHFFNNVCDDKKSHFYNILILDNSSNNEIGNITNFSLRLTDFSSNNKIDESKLNTIIVEKNSSYNLFRYNYITGGKIGLLIGDIELRNEFKCSENWFIGNSIVGLRVFSIMNTQGTVLKGNDLWGNSQGVQITNTENTKIINNEIYKNNSDAIIINNSENVLFIKNHVWDNKGAGLNLSNVSRGEIRGNTFANNHTGVITDRAKKIYMANNKYINNNGSNTGIHAYNSNLTVMGNNILRNNGGGIKLENNTVANIFNNNIFSNEGFQVTNTDNNTLSNISNNYWGNASGPIGNDILGNFTISGYLSEPVSVVLSVLADTLNIAAASIDSVGVFFNNFGKPNDELKIEIKDDKNWVLPLEKNVFNIDSNGVLLNLKIQIPENVNAGIQNKIRIFCKSQTDSTQNAVDSILLISYSPIISNIILSPDSVTINFSDTLKFNFTCYDQYGNQIKSNPIWSASSGKINFDGVFVSDSSEGLVTIGAKIPSNNHVYHSYIYNTKQQIKLNRIKLEQDTVLLNINDTYLFKARAFDQFNFPLFYDCNWSATGGKITSSGFYTADSVSGTFFICAENNSKTIVDTTVVIVNKLTAVNKNYLPSGFKLYQNYPNPFNPSTTLKYELQFESNVKFEIFNILGQRIYFTGSTLQKAGLHKFIWNASGFSSGVYFVRIKAVPLNGKGVFINTIKTMLLK